MNQETLRPVLRTDLVGSAISALAVIAAAGPLSDRIGVPTWTLVALGIVLIPWVGLLYLTTRRATLRPAEVTVVVVGNLAWAVAAAVIVSGLSKCSIGRRQMGRRFVLSRGACDRPNRTPRFDRPEDDG